MPSEWLGFRRRLAARLLEAAGASSVGLLLANGCGGRAEQRDAPMTSQGGAVAGAGGAALVAGGNGQAGTIVIGISGDSGQLMPPIEVQRACIDVGVAGAGGMAGGGGEPAVECPDSSEVATLFECRFGSGRLIEVMGPSIEAGQCCYEAKVDVSSCGYVGRAFLVEGDMLKARSRRGEGWTLPLAPRVDQLSPATRRALAEAWIKDGLFEHASVATFARFAIQLMSVGAPARLLHETLAAGRDEIRHAELCFALASAYAGEPLEPDRFPVDEQLSIDRALEAIVTETVVEGCIGETLAAMQAQAQLVEASDPAVRAALEATVEDETRHAELAWKVVAWAIRAGGTPVRRAAERAFGSFLPPPAPLIGLDGVSLADFAAHGRLTPARARAVALEALEHVVRPVAAGLLELDVFERAACSLASETSPRAVVRDSA